MTMIDGWVGEKVDSNPLVVPDLEPAPQHVASEVISTESIPKPEGDGEQSFIVKLAAAVVLVAALGGIGVVGWPFISGYIFSEDPPAALPFDAEATQQLVMQDGTIYLEGSVPDDAASNMIQSAMEAAVGESRVINNFVISSDAVFDPSLPIQLTVAETVLFQTGASNVADNYRPLIGLAVELMKSREEAILTIIGHTDDIGDEALNLRLSSERAQATADALVALGIDPTRLMTEGRGESQPLVSNDTREGRQTNRRVEFLISGLLG